MDENLREYSGNPETSRSGSPSRKSGGGKAFGVILGGLIILAALVVGIIYLARADTTTTGKIRDIFIIVLAVESIIIGAALVIMVIQIAALFNLLQNEIRPILESTQVTLSTLKGTTAFLSEHAIKPVINMSSMAAGLKKLVSLIGVIHKE